MFAGRALGTLRWFGLLEYRGPPDTAEVGRRKTPCSSASCRSKSVSRRNAGPATE